MITKLVIVNTNVELIADYQRPPNDRSYISDIVASDLLHPSNITSRIIVAKWPLNTTFVFGPVNVCCSLNRKPSIMMYKTNSLHIKMNMAQVWTVVYSGQTF